MDWRPIAHCRQNYTVCRHAKWFRTGYIDAHELLLLLVYVYWKSSLEERRNDASSLKTCNLCHSAPENPRRNDCPRVKTDGFHHLDIRLLSRAGFMVMASSARLFFFTFPHQTFHQYYHYKHHYLASKTRLVKIKG